VVLETKKKHNKHQHTQPQKKKHTIKNKDQKKKNRSMIRNVSRRPAAVDRPSVGPQKRSRRNAPAKKLESEYQGGGAGK